MKFLLSLLILLYCCSPSSDRAHNKEFVEYETGGKVKSGNEQILTLNYNAISCSCAQWSESKYNEQPEKKEYFYLERANSNLINADDFYNGKDFPLQIKVKGTVVKEMGYPSDYNPQKGKGPPGKVFRYTEIQLLQNGYKNSEY